MYCSDNVDKSLYIELMNEIKNINKDWITLRESKQYKIGLVIYEILNDLKHLRAKELLKCITRWQRGIKSKSIKSKIKYDNDVVEEASNYFSTQRIAIYTAVYGTYDRVIEPYCKPDNCDYFIFTDQEPVHENSVWNKRMDPSSINGLSNSEKNRFLKMHPHVIFPEYNYSIYIDGNVQIFTDLTEYVNKLNKIGLGIHSHDTRCCVYDEMRAVVKTGRVPHDVAKRNLRYFEKSGMPRNYGLLQCNVIVREHNNPCCISIMEDWWKEYKEYSKRDQLSLPHVLFRHGIAVNNVAVLGENIYRNPSFRVVQHN